MKPDEKDETATAEETTNTNAETATASEESTEDAAPAKEEE